jgi:hypothetical protein
MGAPPQLFSCPTFRCLNINFRFGPLGVLRFSVSSPFSVDPFADVRRAILELYALPFAVPKENDSVLIHKRQVFQIQDREATAYF